MNDVFYESSGSIQRRMLMLNLTPEKRRHHLRMRRLDKAGKKASRGYWWKNWKFHTIRLWKNLCWAWRSSTEEGKREFKKAVEKRERPLWDRKLERFLFPTQVILVEKNWNATIGMDVFVEFDKHSNIERVIGVDENIDYTYLLDASEHGASLVEPRTGHVIANSRVVESGTGKVLFLSWIVRVLKILVLFIVSEAIFPILWAYRFFKSSEKWGADESDFVSFLWFTWEFLKLAWYPVFLVYYIIKDCRDIQAHTSWWSLVKRLFE